MKLTLFNLPFYHNSRKITFGLPCTLCKFYVTGNNRIMCSIKKINIKSIPIDTREGYIENAEDRENAACSDFKYRPGARKRL